MEERTLKRSKAVIDIPNFFIEGIKLEKEQSSDSRIGSIPIPIPEKKESTIACPLAINNSVEEYYEELEEEPVLLRSYATNDIHKFFNTLPPLPENKEVKSFSNAMFEYHESMGWTKEVPQPVKEKECLKK